MAGITESHWVAGLQVNPTQTTECRNQRPREANKHAFLRVLNSSHQALG